jgi:hypothetical protein
MAAKATMTAASPNQSTGELCKSGYQLGSGNCRKADGRMVAVSKEQCVAMGGLVALPFEGGRGPFDEAQPPKPIK